MFRHSMCICWNGLPLVSCDFRHSCFEAKVAQIVHVEKKVICVHTQTTPKAEMCDMRPLHLQVSKCVVLVPPLHMFFFAL